jgi:radical SAM protein with 4Fe4S-binding SPASM domain
MSKTFCVMPFCHINVKQEGKVSACWRYPDKIGDYTNQTIKEIWNGNEIKELRRQLLNNERPVGCRSCWDMEDSGVRSTRLQTAIDYQNIMDIEKARQTTTDDFSMPLTNLKSIELRFDNICNLMCRHCSPDYSSKWEVTVKKNTRLRNKMIQFGTFRKSDTHVNLNQTTIDEIGHSIAPNLVELMLAGGEPLYHERHYDFIKSMIPHASKIKLSYNSNLTTLDYKGNSILDLWKQFKKVDLRVSLDGDPDCYHYVRAHSGLSTIEENIKLAQRESNIRISATCTTSLLNITRIVSIVEYFLSLGAYFHASLVQYPRALNPKLLPRQIKEKITTEWNDWINNIDINIQRCVKLLPTTDIESHRRNILKFGQMVVDYMNSEDWHDYWSEFVDYSAVLDEHFDTNLIEVYPEYKL